MAPTVNALSALLRIPDTVGLVSYSTSGSWIRAVRVGRFGGDSGAGIEIRPEEWPLLRARIDQAIEDLALLHDLREVKPDRPTRSA